MAIWLQLFKVHFIVPFKYRHLLLIIHSIVLDRSASEGLYSSQGIYSDPSAPAHSTQSSRTNLFGSYSHAVRDVAWHGYEPTLMSTCWDMMGSMRRGGTVAKHEWKGLGKNGLAKLEDWEIRRKEENEGSRATN